MSDEPREVLTDYANSIVLAGDALELVGEISDGLGLIQCTQCKLVWLKELKGQTFMHSHLEAR